MAPEESAAVSSTSLSADERRQRLRDALNEFIAEFSKESDRAAVILVGARLDYLLSELLTRFLLPSTASTDELLDTERALGTFSARIHAAYRLGLIDAAFARALHIFRRLRNTFAHETAGTSFDHGPSRDRIRELAAPVGHFRPFLRLRERFKDKQPTAADFFTVSALLAARLEVACSVVEQVEAAKTSVLIPSEWKTANDENA